VARDVEEAILDRQLENLADVEAIAAAEGVDMVGYGHPDLSARFGVYLLLEHPIQGGRADRGAAHRAREAGRGSAGTEAQIAGTTAAVGAGVDQPA
jgi:2-keto-3-deoxy-L-rhamnonate aldolase RhmA